MHKSFNEILIDRIYVLAGSEMTSPKVLMKLTGNHCQRVRRRVAENPNTPIDGLKVLSRDLDTDVRIGLADNPAAPGGLLLLLAADGCPDVRYALAENHAVPIQILALLARDENPYVADRALCTLAKIATFYPRIAA